MTRSGTTPLAVPDLAPVVPYRAPPWLPGGHLQTLWAAILPAPETAYRRERWELPDGDFLDLDWVGDSDGTPLVVLFHGLEGSSASHYAHSLMAAVRAFGWRGVVPHFRGCSGEANRLPRAYHAGDSAEVGAILTRLKADCCGAPLYVAGVSLGGNALLKWLAEEGEGAQGLVRRAAAVSAPLDLPAAGAALDRGFTRFYTARFLRTLKAKALAKADAYPDLFDGDALRGVTTIRAFDDLFTAPLHGFRDAHEYWHKAASKPWLRHIRVSTLVLNARNDPFLPGDALPRPDEVSDHVILEFPEQGGHVGFVSGPFPGHLDWMPQRLLQHFAGGLA